MSPTARGPVLVLGAATLWGTTGTAQGLGPEGISAPAVAFVRMLGGALLLLWVWRRHAWPDWQRVRPSAAVLAVAAMAGSQPLFFAGVARTGVAVGTMVTIGSGPILAGLLAFLTRGEKVSSRWMVGTVFGVAGAAILATGGEGAGVDAGGIGFALGAGVAWAVYLVATKDLMDAAPPVTVAALVFLGAAIALSPVAVISDMSWVTTTRGLAVVGWLALASTAVSYILFAIGLQKTQVATAATLTLAEPLTASILGPTVLHEPLTATTVIGGMLVLAGLLALSAQRRRRMSGPVTLY